MVDISTYQKQLELRRQEVERAKQQVGQYKTTPDFSQRQLRAVERVRKARFQTPLQQKLERKRKIYERKQAKAKAEQEVQKELQKQEELEKEFTPIKQQYESYQQAKAEQEAYNKALNLYRKGISSRSPAFDRLVKKYLRKFEKVGTAQQEYYSKKLEQAGLSGMRIENLSPKVLEKLSLPQLQSLEKAGLVELKKKVNQNEFTELDSKGGVCPWIPSGDNLLVSSQEYRIPDDSSFFGDIVGSFKKGFQAKEQKEFANITTSKGILVSAYPSGTGATALITPLSPEQKYKFEISQTKLKDIVSSPLKLLGGEYEWQKKIEEGFPKKEGAITPEQVIAYERATPYSELKSPGSFIRKGFYSLGDVFISGTEKVRTDVLGWGDELPKKQKEELGTMAGILFLGEAVSPVISTGTLTKKQKAQLSQTKFDELGEALSADDVTLSLQFKKEGNILRSKTTSEKLDDLRMIIERARGATKSQQKAIQKLLENTYGKENLRGLLKEYLSQEGVNIKPTDTTSIILDVSVNLPPNLERAGTILGGSMFPLVSAQKSPLIEKIILPSKVEILPKDESKIIPTTSQFFKPKEIERQKTKLFQISMLKPLQKPKETLSVLSGLSLIPRIAQRTDTLTKQTSTFRRPQPRQTFRKETTTKRIKIFKLPKPEKKKQLFKKRKKEGLFTPEVRRYGIWKPLGKFKTLEKAKRKGISRVLTTLAASLRIKKGEEILPIAKKNQFFRPSKKDEKILVQRRGKRLSSPLETREIQIARRKKIRFL